MPKHFILTGGVERISSGCSCCEPMELPYYNFEDEEVARVTGTIHYEMAIPIELYEYLGYHIPNHIDDYEELSDYAESKLELLGVTWEIKEENTDGL